MGRYVTGDFEYKFMFGVQPSSDIEMFGGCKLDTNNLVWFGRINWTWNEKDLPVIKEALKELNKKMKEKTNHTFSYWTKRLNGKGYTRASNDDETHTDKWDTMLLLYSRIELGKIIYAAIQEQGDVYVEAEC